MTQKIKRDTVIDRRYQIIEHLGTGGMADVYCAQDLQLGRKVALKVLHDRFAEDDQFVERFRREASSAAGLQHQHVVSVYDRGESDGVAYIAMEFVDGRTLKQIVQQEGPLEPGRAVDLTIQILRAARFAHRRGVIHRDLKPHNVIVDEEGRAKVTDFGIARAGSSDMTETGSIMGTAQYLSPEQAQGLAVSASSDLYAIGIVLYELLTGRVPFDAESTVTIALKQVNEAPVPPSRINPAVTPELEAVVMRAIEKDPARRFADADEFIAALEAAASRLPTTVRAAAEGGGAIAAAPPPPAPPPPIRPLPPPQRPIQPTGAWPAGRAYDYDYEEQSPAAPHARRRWPWAVLIALVAIGAILAGVLLGTTRQVTVANVVGAGQLAASQRLEQDGFRVAIFRDNSGKPLNTVFDQAPKGGARVDKGSTVTLSVSDGPATSGVPGVIGDGHALATKKLKAAGFNVKEELAFSDQPLNHVIAQAPPEGSQIAPGTVVKITTSKGQQQTATPPVTGKSQDDATNALNDAGFRVHTKPKPSSADAPGTVLSQDPAAGTQLPPNAVVTLTIATQSKTVAVPDVVGRSQNAATETLSAAGFVVVPQDAPVDTPDQDGIVQSQTPPGNEKKDRSSRVIIVIGRFTQTPTVPGTDTTPTTTDTTPTAP